MAPVQLGTVEGADHRERRQVHADGPQSGLARRVEQPLDHVAARGDDDHAGALPLGGVDDAERVVLEHRLLKRHRDVVGRLEADGGADLLRPLERRQIERAHDDALVGDAQADALAELVGGEQVAQRRRESLDVDDLAVADDAGGQLGARGALDRYVAGPGLDGGDVAGFDVEADDRFCFRVPHGSGQVIDRNPRRVEGIEC